MKSDCFYYGTYTPEGFCTLTQRAEFRAKKNLILKGYSDSLKQSLFSSLKSELEKRGYGYIDFCADDRSMGIYSADADFCVVDGTYGRNECEAETLLLDNAVTKEHKECLKRRENAVQRAQRFLAACRCINNDMVRLESANMDILKINRYSTYLWTSTGGALKGNVGTEHKRFVTCFTSDGVELNMEAFDMYCDRITLICDRTGACARKIVDRVRRYALSAGYDVISCLCPMNADAGAEHLIIPELRYGIFVSKYFHKGDFENCRKVYASRFIVSSNAETKNRMDFSHKAYKRLMQEVFSSLKTVKLCDEELDRLSAGSFLYYNERGFFENLFSS